MAISIGLELGDSILRAVILEQQETRVRLIAQAQLPWSGEAAHDLTASLTQLRKTLPIAHPVVVGIPTSCAIVTTVQPLVVHRKRAALAVEFELQQHLPYDADQAVGRIVRLRRTAQVVGRSWPPRNNPCLKSG
jgi:hypothetical protein